MTEQRLTDLAQLSIEREALEETNINDIIDQFATFAKSEKNMFKLKFLLLTN